MVLHVPVNKQKNSKQPIKVNPKPCHAFNLHVEVLVNLWHGRIKHLRANGADALVVAFLQVGSHRAHVVDSAQDALLAETARNCDQWHFDVFVLLARRQLFLQSSCFTQRLAVGNAFSNFRSCDEFLKVIKTKRLHNALFTQE